MVLLINLQTSFQSLTFGPTLCFFPTLCTKSFTNEALRFFFVRLKHSFLAESFFLFGDISSVAYQAGLWKPEALRNNSRYYKQLESRSANLSLPYQLLAESNSRNPQNGRRSRN